VLFRFFRTSIPPPGALSCSHPMGADRKITSLTNTSRESNELHKFPSHLIALMNTYVHLLLYKCTTPSHVTFLRRFLRLAVWVDVNFQHCEGSAFLFSTTIISHLCLSTRSPDPNVNYSPIFIIQWNTLTRRSIVA